MQNKLGQVFTNQKVVEFILDEIDFFHKNCLQKTIIDITCGDGAFLTAIVKRIIKYSTNEEFKTNLTFIHGWDIDKNQIEKCKENLNQIYETNWNIENCDALIKGLRTDNIYDLVIGNPPYISYNESCKQNIEIIKQIKKRHIKMSNIFGINLNSTPYKTKTYPPKPNLYAFFIALGYKIIKEDGMLCYLIPQTILTANDLDVLRYHFSHFSTIEKIIIFDNNLFDVPTSSLIIIIKKSKYDEKHLVKIIKNNNEKTILQKKLKNNIDNWNFITKPSKVFNFLETYQKNTESFDVYRLFEKSVPRYNDKFYFDVGFILNKEHFKDENDGNCYEILDFKNIKGYSDFKATKFYPKNTNLIKLTRSNQGYKTLNKKYSIVWRIKNNTGFKLINKPIIFNMGTAGIITSNNQQEMLYLFSLLNSKINTFILKMYLKIPNEKDYLVSILSIKKYIRIPKITINNKHIKDEIIEKTKKLLESNTNEQMLLKKEIDKKISNLYTDKSN